MHLEYKKWKKKKERIPAHSIYEITINNYSNCELILNSEEQASTI